MRVRFPVMALALALSHPPAALADWAAFGRNLLKNAPQIVGDAVRNKDALSGEVDEGQEREMGRAAASVLLGAAPVVEDGALQTYVNTVGRWLAIHTERPDLPWRFAVLRDETVNAFAAPGGYVFVSSGLFVILRNEHELAGVLAHEIGHVLEKHHVRALTKKEQWRFAVDTATAVTDTKGLLADALVSASKDLYSSGLDKADEYAADRAGVVVAARAGYDPYGLTHALASIDALGSGTDYLDLFLSTHPPTRSRIDALYATMADALTIEGDPVVDDEFERMKLRLLSGQER